MAKTNTQIKREQLVRDVPGATNQTPLGQLESNYYKAQSGITGNSLANQRLVTLRKIIVASGGTPRSNFQSDLLKQALAAKGLPVTNSFQQNWRVLRLSL